VRTLIKIAVFASGTGSNYEAIERYVQSNPQLGLEVALVITDQPHAGVLERAANWKTPAVVVDRKAFDTKTDFETEILRQLQLYKIDFVALAGYMRIVGPTLLQHYYGKIINLHPSLLPAFRGKDAVGQALEAGVRVTGVTVHFVDAGMDTGPIIAQQAVSIERNDTHASLTQKIHMIEHQLYPKIVCACALGWIYLNGRQVCWCEETEQLGVK